MAQYPRAPRSTHVTTRGMTYHLFCILRVLSCTIELPREPSPRTIRQRACFASLSLTTRCRACIKPSQLRQARSLRNGYSTQLPRNAYHPPVIHTAASNPPAFTNPALSPSRGESHRVKQRKLDRNCELGATCRLTWKPHKTLCYPSR